jgi:GTP diphosphokinase / guanosine-3',5'-bis(diphosphate) 3'-diphosphatase
MKTNFDARSLPQFVRALEIASRKHSTQRRKDAVSSPYINHPIALVSILAVEAGIDDSGVLCAALLHDTIEDTDTTRDELAETFGSTIADIVVEVTDDKQLSKHVRKQLQIEHAPALSRAAGLVKCADKIANLRDLAECPPPDWALERRQEFDWAKSVVDGVRDVPPGLRQLFNTAYERHPSG